MKTFTPINEPDTLCTLCTCGAEKDRHGPKLECPARVALAPGNLSPEAFEQLSRSVEATFAEEFKPAEVINLGTERDRRQHEAGHAAYEAGEAFKLHLFDFASEPLGFVEGDRPVALLFNEATGEGLAMTRETALKLGQALLDLDKSPHAPWNTAPAQVDPDGERYRPELVAVGEFAMPESQAAADVASEPSNWDVVDRDEVEMLWLEAENVVLCLHCAGKRGVTPGQPGTDPVERGDDYVREGGHCFDCGESPYSPDRD